MRQQRRFILHDAHFQVSAQRERAHHFHETTHAAQVADARVHFSA